MCRVLVACAGVCGSAYAKNFRDVTIPGMECLRHRLLPPTRWAMCLLDRGDRLCIFTATCLPKFRSASSSLICSSLVMVSAGTWYQMGSEECLFPAHSHFQAFAQVRLVATPHLRTTIFSLPPKLTHTLSSPLNMQRVSASNAYVKTNRID